MHYWERSVLCVVGEPKRSKDSIPNNTMLSFLTAVNQNEWEERGGGGNMVFSVIWFPSRRKDYDYMRAMGGDERYK